MKLTLRAKRVFVGAAAGALVLSLLPTAAAADSHVCDNAAEDVFPDVTAGATHADNIDCIFSYGITTGYGDGEYKPTNPVDRQEMATFLVRTWEAATGEDAPAGDSDFTDLDDAALSHQANIETAAEAGIADGYPDNTYRPLEDVSRNQMASFVVNLMDSLGADLPDDPDAAFPDVESTSVHYEAINQLAELGIVQGYADGTYGPWDNVQRQEMASFIVRAALELSAQDLWEGSIPPPEGVANPTYTDAPELLRVTQVGSDVLSYEFDSTVTGEALDQDVDGYFPDIRVYDHEDGYVSPSEASIDGDRILARFDDENLVSTASRATIRYAGVESPIGLPGLEGAYFLAMTSEPIATDPFHPDLISVDNYRTGPSQIGDTAVLVDFTFGPTPGFDEDAGDDWTDAADYIGVGDLVIGDTGDDYDAFNLVGAEAGLFPAVGLNSATASEAGATFTLEFQVDDVDELPESQLRRGYVNVDVTGTDPFVLAENYGTTGGITFEPDLVSVERDGDTFAFEFDEPVSAAQLGDEVNFAVYNNSGEVFEMDSVVRSNLPEDEARVVYGTRTGLEADGHDDAPVGAFVRDAENGADDTSNAVLGTDTQAGENNGWNRADQVNLTLTIDEEEVTAAGVTEYHDLESVVRTRNIVTGTYSVTFNFTDTIDSTDANQIAFHLYEANGTQFDADGTDATTVSGSSVTFDGGDGFSNDQIAAASVGAVEDLVRSPAADTDASEGAFGIEDTEN